MQYGLLGRKLGHSYSPRIHASLGEYDYALFEKEPEELAEFLAHGDFTGINVTIPYKKAVMEHLDELSPRARQLGAVNTIVRRDDGKLVGHNTDYFGFLSMVQKSKLDPAGKKCLVLGSGGASNTAVAVLRELGAHVVVISRQGENNYRNLHRHADASIVVNTTPVGMYPDTGLSPVDLSLFPRLEGVLDVVYNPARTKLLLDAEARGLIAMNGLWMLVAQAKEASQWFQGNDLPDSVIETVYRQLRMDMENIVLIGMPGCGKSTVGKLLADKLERQFVDADLAIEELAGKPIPRIFAEDGEEHFRKLESKVLAALGKQSGLIIATGGGCVTRQENYTSLHQNGVIVWLTRRLDRLPVTGRPLSQATKAEDMYRIRKPLYQHFADCIVDNDGSLESTFDRLTGALEVMP